MQRSTQRRIVFLSGVFVFGAIVAAACSFPDPEIRPLDDEAGSDGSDGDNPDTSDDGGVEADAPLLTDVVVLVDGQEPDALIVQDAGQKIEAGEAGCTNPCDCDKDGYERPSCGNDSGMDCDDLDQRAHPDQGFLEAPSEPPLNGNWNCVNGVEKLYPANVNCGGVALGACNGVQGFADDPGCGQEGTYIFCTTSTIFCVEGASQSRKQACK